MPHVLRCVIGYSCQHAWGLSVKFNCTKFSPSKISDFQILYLENVSQWKSLYIRSIYIHIYIGLKIWCCCTVHTVSYKSFAIARKVQNFFPTEYSPFTISILQLSVEIPWLYIDSIMKPHSQSFNMYCRIAVSIYSAESKGFPSFLMSVLYHLFHLILLSW